MNQLVDEGQLKRRCVGLRKIIVCNDEPQITENGKLYQQPYASMRLPYPEEASQVIDEAKKDLFEPMIILEAIDKPHVNDYACTYQKLQDRLIKWFGDST